MDFPAFDKVRDLPAGYRDLVGRREYRAVLVQPARLLTVRLQLLDAPGTRVEAEDLRLAEATSAVIPERADDVDEVSDQRRRVEVGGWEYGFRVALDVNRTARLVDEHVVVDAEVRVVAVLVLAANLHDASVGQERDRLPEALRAPDRRVGHR